MKQFKFTTEDSYGNQTTHIIEGPSSGSIEEASDKFKQYVPNQKTNDIISIVVKEK